MINSLLVYKDERDEIYEHLGVAVMPCGHKVSRDGMFQIVKYQLSQGKTSINCPHVDTNTNNRCNVEWEFVLCKKVAVLTLE